MCEQCNRSANEQIIAAAPLGGRPPGETAPLFPVNAGELAPEPSSLPEEVEEDGEPSVTCSNCATVVPEDEGRTGLDGNELCEDCYCELVAYCEVCETDVPADDCSSARRADGSRRGAERICCDSCSFQCQGCSERFYGDSLSADGFEGEYCSECYSEEFSTCDGCSCDCRRETMESTESEYLCRDCYREHEHDNNGPIHSYDYKPSPVFRTDSGSSTYPDPAAMYFGIELESEFPRNTDSDSSGNRSAVESVTDSGLWYAKSDGSLDNGVEFVSHPATLAFWRNMRFDWADTLGNKGFRAHNTTTCGIHIHVSRESLSDVEWLKVSKLFRDNGPLIRKAARRPMSSYAKNVEGTNAKLLRKIRRAPGVERDRYQAINFLNHATVEFRIFRSTLKGSSVLRYVEFVNAVCQFAKSHPMSAMSSATFQKWLMGPQGTERLGEPAALSLVEWLFSDSLVTNEA